MKRDMNLIKRLLVRIEQECHGDGIETFENDEVLNEEGYDSLQITYHAKLVWDQLLIDATEVGTSDGPGVAVKRLTAQGHDFLDAARDEMVWQKAMQKIGGPLAGIPIDVLRDLLIQYVRQKFGLPI